MAIKYCLILGSVSVSTQDMGMKTHNVLTLGGTVLNIIVNKKDLRLTIRADMKVSEQCGIAAAKGNQILGLIRRNIVYKEKELIILLYKTIVRRHLKYCIQAWRPHRKKGIDMLERVQRRATKMMPKLRNISYEKNVV